ncbi:MAG: CBS domain-containing protein [Nevskiales bacterium]|nr:CBS domain-containing protein [Nevskiales bacterium]
MTRALITVGDGETIESTMHTMHQNNVSCVVVEPNAQGEWGIVTRRDIVTKIVYANRSTATTKVKDIASRPLFSVPVETSLREASRLLADRNFSRLAIAQGDKIIGIVTETDVFNAVERFGWVE